MVTRKELISKYIDFFKGQDHKLIPNASLLPENDPTVLFITAGMQPLVPFLSGRPYPSGKRLVGVQQCIRTGDIEEVGDTVHHTLFEMLGNWSLGDYFKKEAINYSFEFLTKQLEIPLERLAVSVFAGDKDAPRDEESAQIWQDLGVPAQRIAYLDKKHNWWGPAGQTGVCGPDTEMFYWKRNDTPAPDEFDPTDDNWVEIWNDVLMTFDKQKDGSYAPAKQKNIDTGMGVERVVAILDGLEDNYLAGMWKPIIDEIIMLSKKDYEDNAREIRIVADHLKASCFILNSGIKPGNSEQGYVLRRLIRGAIRNLKKLDVISSQSDALPIVAKTVFSLYDDYNWKQEEIIKELKAEEAKFEKTLDKGLREFEKLAKKKSLTGKESFLLYQSFGFPIEMIQELSNENKVEFDPKAFDEELKKHQSLSQTASAGKFKSGLADHSDTTTKLHTATHLLLAALKKVLGDDVNQKGSNITPERLRFDFNFDRPLTPEEKQQVQDLVNKQIKADLPVTKEEMSLANAKASGATGVFDGKYGEHVFVYTVGDFSKELCTGPHVDRTGKLGTFKIKSEKSSSAGVRRIKAVLTD